MITDTHRHSGGATDGNKIQYTAIEKLFAYIQSKVTDDPVGLEYEVERINPSFNSGDESFTTAFQPKLIIMFGFATDTFAPAQANYFTYGFGDADNNYCLSKNGDKQVTGLTKDTSIREYLASNGWSSDNYARLTLKTLNATSFTTTAETYNIAADGGSVGLGRYIYLAIG